MILRIYRNIVVYSGLTFLGILLFSIRKITFGKGINFNRIFVAPLICRIILFCVGVRVHNQIQKDLHPGNVIYFFNHNSFLDVFIIPMLGLKNTRFIITEGVKKIIPLHLANLGIDVLYIPDTHETERRIQFFKQVTTALKEGQYSVICSPEGRHSFLYGIAPFNRGVFHMATASQRPIHTLFFEIPKEANPVKNNVMKSCAVTIKSMELIETTSWTEEEISLNKEKVREKFLAYYKNHYGDYGESP